MAAKAAEEKRGAAPLRVQFGDRAEFQVKVRVLHFPELANGSNFFDPRAEIKSAGNSARRLRCASACMGNHAEYLLQTLNIGRPTCVVEKQFLILRTCRRFLRGTYAGQLSESVSRAHFR